MSDLIFKIPGFRWRVAALKNGILDATAYRWEFFIDLLSSALVPACIQLLLWYALFTLGGKTEIQGQTHIQMIHYTMMSVLFSQVRGGNHDFDLIELIRTGQLSQYLLRPVGAVEFIYIQGLGGKLLVSAFCLMVGIGVSFFTDYSAINMVAAMILALLGNLIHYQIGAALAASAFQWEESYSVLMVKNLAVSFLSGELIPLNLFPESMQWIWKSTPFYLYVFGPVQMAMGKWTWLEFASHLGIAFIWIGICWALVKLTWSVGLKKYLSLGG
jgi:ABC-2 type transport system permease protein